MKTKKTLWKRISIVLALSIVTTVGILYSCEKENIAPSIAPSSEVPMRVNEELPRDIFGDKRICGTVIRKDLLLEGVGRVGNVFLFNDTKFFYVYVVANRGYGLKDAYLFNGTRADLPLTMDGDLEYKRFNNTITADEFIRSRNFKIPLAQMHAISVNALALEMKNLNPTNEASRPKIAWADGKQIGNFSLGRVFQYTKGVCLINDPISAEELAE